MASPIRAGKLALTQGLSTPGDAMPKVLYVSHNHPSNRPGGAELYAHELFRAIRDDGEFQATFLAKAGPPMSSMQAAHRGTRLALNGEGSEEYFLYTDRGEIDLVFGVARDLSLYTHEWRSFLQATRPDVVHFQHTLFLGYDMVRETRNTLPDVPIVYTLHEFLPICHHNGQMVRVDSYELCDHASPRRCNQCFPHIPVARFYLRERFIKSALSAVDLFIAPSRQLRERYIEWGIPAEKIVFEDYGRLPVTADPEPPEAGERHRIGYFGQITRYKGVDVLLEAMKLLAQDETPVRLTLHGANLEHQHADFQARINELLAQTAEVVRFAGRYEPSMLPGLLAEVDWVVVPSVWWENSPLVIQEAQMHGRPVICSAIGGMAEKVRDGVDGLHFTVGDPQSLADAIRRAVTTPNLWGTLRSQITGAHTMEAHLPMIKRTYHELLAAAGAATAA
jgi:glycosyltransferase involved in cell wall biosynthesis